MNRPIKIVLMVCVALLAIVLLPLLALVLLVDPNSFKPQVVAAVKQQTGREFRIDGELGWSFYPVLGIELGRTELGNARGFGEQPMLAAERVAVGVELLPLIDGEQGPQARDEVSGAVEDARPDRWGERVIEVIEKPSRRSLMEYLLFAGEHAGQTHSITRRALERLDAAGLVQPLEDRPVVQRAIDTLANELPLPG